MPDPGSMTERELARENSCRLKAIRIGRLDRRFASSPSLRCAPRGGHRRIVIHSDRISALIPGSPGIDGVTFDAIEAGGVEGFLKQLREELVTGEYRR